MTGQNPASRNSGSKRATRRGVLAGLGALTISGLGTTASSAATSTASKDDTASNQEHQFPAASHLEAFVDKVLARRIGDATPGATVAIVRSDGPVLIKGYGDANVDSGTPVQALETAFRVGSVGKLVTWTAVMQSVEQGVLNLDEDVNHYLDGSAVSVPETYEDPVTLRQLGTHTAGFESAIDPEVVTDPDAITPLETVLVEQMPPRVRPPGEVVGYSNYGAALAGHIVAEVHDTTFEKYVQTEIFEPLGMTHATFTQPVSDDYPGSLAAGHSQDGEEFRTADEVYINMRPAGSMTATARDIAWFMRAHLRNGAVGNTQILQAGTARRMRERHHVRHPAVTNWRYGFHEYGNPGSGVIGHSGATVHFSSHLVLLPASDVGIFVNYNSNNNDYPPPATVIDDILTEYGLQSPPTEPTPITEPESHERATEVAGEYSLTSLPRSGPLQVVDLLEHVSVEPAADSRLRTTTLDGHTRYWVETEPYVYQAVNGHDVLAFEVTDGAIEGMYLASEPTGVYQPVPSHERQLVTGSVLGGTLTGFGLSLAGWGGQAAWRQWTQYRTDEDSDTEMGSTE
ncbi:serine hydrolase domain-containing protein [Halobellus ordinarius]|uniref:serine hydrolase domain-containing protein n=1 Tax=Halobellus ordinarius TaxID=3075120 RepID=UPI00287FF5F1|nr:serine hydrolase domain-containing protein [Halobellus sp. ZY16]